MESEYMSFSTEVKNELCSVSMSRACCTRAEAYGALLQKVGHGRMHLFDHGAHPAMLSNPEAFYQLSMEFLQG